MNTLCVGLRPYLSRLAMVVALVVFVLVVTPALSGQAFLPANNFRTGGGAAAVAVGDLNADGKPDFAVANAYDGTVSVLYNTGNGTFAAPATYPVGTQPTAIAVADVNGDGRPDIITANNGENNVSVLLNTGTGFKAAVKYTAGNSPVGVAVADFNGDGKPDLAVAEGSFGVTLLFNDTKQLNPGTFPTFSHFASSCPMTSLVAGDLNLDGNVDVAGGCGNGSFEIFYGNGKGALTAPAIVDLAVAVKDLE